MDLPGEVDLPDLKVELEERVGGDYAEEDDEAKEDEDAPSDKIVPE